MHPDSWRYRGCLIFLVYHILPGYFPSGGLGARLYRERYASLRVFTP